MNTMNSDEIHKAFNETFMGHKIDGIIIAPPMTFTDDENEACRIVQEAYRDYALYNLNREAKILETLHKEDHRTLPYNRSENKDD